MTRARDVADAGHSTTATTADTISQKSSINLSGTYSTHQLLVADAYALTGNVTVNDNLILGKLSNDGNDLVLEGSHTLQGTGQLEAGYITSSGIGSVDGMTGTLGSEITLGSGATIDSGVTGTLGSGVTFPAGHILQVVSLASDASTTASTTSWVLTGLDLSITPSSSSSTILVFISSNMGGVDGSPRIKMTRTPSGGSEVDVNVNSATGDPVGMIADARLSNVQLGAPTQMYFEDSPSAIVSVRYRVYIRSAESKNVYFGRSSYSSSPDGEYKVKSNMILMEVSG